VKSITPGGLAQRLDNGATPFLLDVREPDELVDDGCLAGSVNIPMDEVEDRLGEIPTDREIVVYCHLGARSAHITKKLNALGYDRAMNLTGGYDAYLEAPFLSTSETSSE
jgi:rhodanese-related sulfurtransferase